MIETLQTTPVYLAALFAFVAAMTPGPNNIMLLSSGLTFGMRRTLPHMLGVFFGFFIISTILVIGLGAAIIALPSIRFALLIAGSIFMFYLAYKVITAPTDLKQREAKRPIRFIEAMAFQAINPKGLGFGLSYVAMVAGLSPTGEIGFWLGVIAIIMPQITTGISVVTWTGLGQFMARLIGNPKRVRVINVVLGSTLFLMIPLMFWSELNDIIQAWGKA